MPQLLPQLLKAQLVSFIVQNDESVTADEVAPLTKDQLVVRVRQILDSAGIPADSYDFITNRVLMSNPGLVSQVTRDGSRDNVVSSSLSATLPAPAPFELEPSADAFDRWSDFVDAFELYAEATLDDSTSSHKKRVTFLCVAGTAVQRLLKSLVEDADNPDEYKRATKALTDHFEGRANFRFDRFQFGELTQGSEETVASYVARLRRIGQRCQFTDVEDRILDHLIRTVHNPALRQKWLAVGTKLSFKQALESAQAMEVSSAQAKAIVSSTQPQVAAIQREKPPPTGLCRFCKKTHVLSRDKCPAFGKKCDTCFQMHHFSGSLACRRRRSPEESKRSPGSGNQRRHSHGRRVRAIDNDDVPEVISCVRKAKEKASLSTNLIIGGKSVKCCLDTGSAVNLLPRKYVPDGSR